MTTTMTDTSMEILVGAMSSDMMKELVCKVNGLTRHEFLEFVDQIHGSEFANYLRKYAEKSDKESA